MSGREMFRTGAKWTASVLGLAFGAYTGYVATTWIGYGRPPRTKREDTDLLLDRVLPDYEVGEHHQIHVAAPTEITFSTACDMDLMRSPIIRAIFRTRELVLGADHHPVNSAAGLLRFSQSVGWNVLAEIPGREIVMGAVTQPWNANVVFRSLSPDEFIAFDEPGYVKIVWTIRADPDGESQSLFRHDTRVATTDAVARAKFRTYWAFLSPGIKLIRLLLLKPLRAEAELRAQFAATPVGSV